MNIKDYNVMIDGKTFLINQLKMTTGQGDDYTSSCLLDYNNFNKHYQMRAIDLSKQQAMMSIQKQYNKLVLVEI